MGSSTKYRSDAVMTFDMDPNESKKPLEGIAAWQYTSCGSICGYDGNIDLDIIYRDIQNTTAGGFVPGTYTVTASAIRIRKEAGTGYEQKMAKETAGGSANMYGRAVYKKGSTMEVSEIIRIKDDEIWGRTVDGYVALMFGGKKYVESIRD